MAKQIYRDYVVGLITGHFNTTRTITEEGVQLVRYFVPIVENKNPPLNYLLKTQDKDKSVQQLLQKEQLIYPPLIINRSEFSKSEVEKKELKIRKQQFKNSINAVNFAQAYTYDFETWKYIHALNNSKNN